ncbi:ATP-dependent RNA helicase DDX24-like [Panonychus citri]|uniref:ATP-dependent RNA helicase DDX24-like n=1 Tax=Panonychus citri TaxID=50023 RepID=UPI002307C948|nr:ATP-dependent RNA helicase DDX24-like [Panonychus citri]
MSKESDADDITEAILDETKSETWESLGVSENIINALNEHGLTEPTDIQKGIIKPALSGIYDLLGAAPTGSGKTLAFGIPLIQKIQEKKDYYGDSKLRGLIITPTRELAQQIKIHLDRAAKFTTVKIAVVFGGLSTQRQERILTKGQPDILVATPGRLWEIINEMEIPHVSHKSVSHIRYLVIDEADRMTEKGYFSELTNILSIIKEKGAKIHRQVFLLSATLTFISKGPKLIKKMKQPKLRSKLRHISRIIGMKNHKIIVDLTAGGVGTPSREQLSIFKIECLKEEKDLYLYYFLLAHPGRSIVFCNSKDCLRRLQHLLTILDQKPIPLHAAMEQKRRLSNLERFSADPRGILLASDVAARGLDISYVDHVIHYQVPRTAELYIHRSGRTARMSNKGISLLLCEPAESYTYRKLCGSINDSQDLDSFPIDDVKLNRLRERLGIARELDVLTHRQKKVKSHDDFFRRMAKECEIDLEDRDDLWMKDEDSAPKENKKIKNLQNQLKNLLKKNVF